MQKLRPIALALVTLMWIAPGLVLAQDATESAVEEPLDYRAVNLEATVLERYGIPGVPNRTKIPCVPISKDDPCLATGYVDAIEKGEPYISLWKAESLIHEQDDVGAYGLLKDLSRRYPKNSRSYWLQAKNLFFRAERLPRNAQKRRAVVLDEAVEWAKKCVKVNPKDINCHLHLGTAIGRWSTNNGILNSVWNGDDVEDAWLYSLKLGQHYRFPSGNTSLGASNYALGIFYRLAPDSFWLELFFGFL